MDELQRERNFMPEKKPLIQVLDRALDLMEMLARSKTPLRATDIAREMGLSLQSANNLLRALYLRGYLSQDESRSYRLGPQCLYLGSFADRWSELRAAVAPALAELTRKTGLSGFVGIIENDKLLCVALVPAELPKLPIQPPQLWMEELHCTACGRVLLAALTQEERRRLFARTTRRKITGRTEVDSAVLEQLCSEVAEAGFAAVDDESRQGVSSLAIPLRDENGKVYATIALSGGRGKWELLSFERKLEALKEAASKIRR